MGKYLNRNPFSFERGLNSEIYVDKSDLIAFTNRKINTQQSYICVSRPRRFGKSMAADMLSAYYACGYDTRALFAGLKAENDKQFEKHLNRYNVLKLDMQSFMSDTDSVEEMLVLLRSEVVKDIRRAYPDSFWAEEDTLWGIFMDILDETGMQLVLLIDEWDCVMRRYHDLKSQKKYLDFLRNLIKDQSYIALAYMTGILPIKKYGEHSTLNMFYEYSMMDSAEISNCFGFTEKEVSELCEQYHMDFAQAKEWYDGYHLLDHTKGDTIEYSMYSPKSVVESMLRHQYGTYWSQTETYEALKEYIQMNKDGLRDSIVQMLSGQGVPVNTRHFQNDMNTFVTKDDILTLLVHLGYLTYDQEKETVTIPNKEVAQEFVASIEMIPAYDTVNRAIQDSKALLQALWNMEEDTVAKGMEKAHQEISILKYNDENALSCTIQLAFYYAREYYQIVRELPTGKGFADIVLIPRPRYSDIPAVIMELKWDETAETALNQIKEKQYSESLKDYQGQLLLCGINYDKTSKKHVCKIERY